jgi:ATP-dependent RNA helicase DHX36
MYDPQRGMSPLLTRWISKSSVKQRAGRAGRVQNGHYYGLYMKERADKFREMELAEILCSDLQEVCLRTAGMTQSYKIPLRAFLQTWIQPPTTVAVISSVSALQGIGALTDDEKLTSLGHVLESFPVHPAMGKRILLGLIFRCLDPMIILAASFGMKDMWINSSLPDHKQAARLTRMMFAKDSSSDHIAIINAFVEARAKGEELGEFRGRRWLENNFIHFSTFRAIYRIAEQIEQILVDKRLMPCTELENTYLAFGPAEVNTNSSNGALVKALLVAGLHPNLAAAHSPQLLRVSNADTASLTQSSVNANKTGGRIVGTLFAFSELAKTPVGGYQCRSSTAISPLMAALFCRNLHHEGLKQNSNVLVVDGWLKFTVESGYYAREIVALKQALDAALSNAYAELQTNAGSLLYLHCDPAREQLAKQLTQLLDIDVKRYEEVLIAKPPFTAVKRKKNRNRR